MKDVILRNLERLALSDSEAEREQIEPMTEWKWQRLYQIVCKYHVGPWVAEGIKAYSDDFFLQMSPALRQKFLDLQGERSEEDLDRLLLQIDRSQGKLNHLKKASLRAYADELIKTIKNIEE